MLVVVVVVLVAVVALEVFLAHVDVCLLVEAIFRSSLKETDVQAVFCVCLCIPPT